MGSSAPRLERFWFYRWPLFASAVAVPLALYAFVTSLGWIGTPFPGFFLMENAVVPTVSGYSWPPDKERLFHSRVTAVDGVAVRSSRDLYGYVASRPPRTTIRYSLDRQGESREVTLPSMRFRLLDYLQTYGILMFFGTTTLGLGLAVGFLQPSTTQARVFLLHTFIAGLYPVTAVFLHHPDFHWLNRLCLVAECMAPAAFVHLALVFPIDRRFPRRWRFLPFLPYALSAALAVAVLRGFYSEPPNLTPLHVAYLYLASCLVFFCLMMAIAYRANIDPVARSRIQAVVPGAIIAAGVQALFFAENATGARNLPVQLGLLAPIPYYSAIAYAIAKHDLFDVDRVVRQSFVYAVLTVLVIAFYALLLLVPMQLVPALARQQALFNVLFVVLLAFILEPLRGGVQNLVDRAFYRSRLDYRATISELSSVMTTLLNLQEVAAQVTRVVTSAMQLESIALCLFGEGDEGVAWSRATDETMRHRPLDPRLAALRPVWADQMEEGGVGAITSRIEDEEARDGARRALAELGATVVLPLGFRGAAIGFLVLGRKRSGQVFGSFDIELLRTLADQTAIAVQNARSYAALAEITRDLDAKVRQRTEELHASNRELSRAYEELKSAQSQLIQSEKMASLGQLVAGVAHELNNPASFVHGGLANLEDYFNAFAEVLRAYEGLPIDDPSWLQQVRDARDRNRLDYKQREMPELLRICAEGSERIKRIVDDLRIFVRADRGERGRTEIVQGLQSTIRLLSDRFQRSGVTLKEDYAALPQVDANATQMNQVWMNLLSNALDAVETSSDPCVTVATSVQPRDGETLGSDGSVVEVRITDNGRGIAEADLGRVFEPFFTTKPIGKGTGLGLSIAYGAVKSHGGTIAIESVPGRGTAVTVRLPVGH